MTTTHALPGRGNGRDFRLIDGSIIDEHDLLIAKVTETHVMDIGIELEGDSLVVIPCGKHSGRDPEPSMEMLSMWSSDSWEPFNERVETLIETNPSRVIVQPGVGGRLSDAICTVSWSATHREVPLLIDPGGWLTPMMLGDLEDHLTRFSTMMEELPNIWGVVMGSAKLEGDRVVGCSFDDSEGVIGRDRAESLFGRFGHRVWI